MSRCLLCRALHPQGGLAKHHPYLPAAPPRTDKLEVRFRVCVACGICCWPVACIAKATTGWGDYRKSAPFFDTDPAREWPLTTAAAAAVPQQQVMRDAGMGVRAVPEGAALEADAIVTR